MRICLIGVALVMTVGARAGGVLAKPSPKTVICAQLKNGPHATYTMQLNRKRLNGTTWTVFATGVPCQKALTAAKVILKAWPQAKIDGDVYTGNGFGCTKESDGHGSAGTVGCSYNGPDHGLDNIELMMTGPYTIAQLKTMFYIS